MNTKDAVIQTPLTRTEVATADILSRGLGSATLDIDVRVSYDRPSELVGCFCTGSLSR